MLQQSSSIPMNSHVEAKLNPIQLTALQASQQTRSTYAPNSPRKSSSKISYRLPGSGLVCPVESSIPTKIKLAVTRDEAAKMLSVCVKTLDRLVNNLTIRSIKLGRRRIFSLADIETCLQLNVGSTLALGLTAKPVNKLPLTVNRQEAADMLSVGLRLFDRIVASGLVPKVQFTRKIVFLTSDLVSFLQKQSNENLNI